jgi:competence protein ComEA
LLLSTAVVFSSGVLGQSSAEDAADKKAFETVCGACHSVSMADGMRSEEEWIDTVEKMARIGATGSDEQFDRLMRFLLHTMTKVNINSATASQIAPVLEISDATAEAVVKRRSEIGKFKALGDLKRIPGVDPAKLEARKDRIVF